MVIGLLELPYHATSLKAPLCQHDPRFLGDFLRVGLSLRPAKSLKGHCRMTNLCGVSHVQMDAPIFKVEPLTFSAMLLGTPVLLAGMPQQSAPIDGRSPELYNV